MEYFKLYKASFFLQGSYYSQLMRFCTWLFL